jgi:hypothetical protein
VSVFDIRVRIQLHLYDDRVGQIRSPPMDSNLVQMRLLQHILEAPDGYVRRRNVLTWIERDAIVAEVCVGLRQCCGVVGTIGHAKQGTAPELLDS